MSCSKRLGVRVEQENVPSSVDELAEPSKCMCDARQCVALCACGWADSDTARDIPRTSHGEKSGLRWTQDVTLGVLSSSL